MASSKERWQRERGKILHAMNRFRFHFHFPCHFQAWILLFWSDKFVHLLWFALLLQVSSGAHAPQRLQVNWVSIRAHTFTNSIGMNQNKCKQSTCRVAIRSVCVSSNTRAHVCAYYPCVWCVPPSNFFRFFRSLSSHRIFLNFIFLLPFPFLISIWSTSFSLHTTAAAIKYHALTPIKHITHTCAWLCVSFCSYNLWSINITFSLQILHDSVFMNYFIMYTHAGIGKKGSLNTDKSTKIFNDNYANAKEDDEWSAVTLIAICCEFCFGQRKLEKKEAKVKCHSSHTCSERESWDLAITLKVSYRNVFIEIYQFDIKPLSSISHTSRSHW